MKSNKGLTIVELVISIVIISIVLTFIMNLYIRVRNIQKSEAIAMEYELTKSIIIDSVGQDIINYGVKKTDPQTSEKTTTIKITYKNNTEATLSTNDTEITYKTIKRKLPNETTIGKMKLTNKDNQLYEIKIPITSSDGENYDINIYFRKEEEEEHE